MIEEHSEANVNWYYWSHPSCKVAFSKSLSKRAPIMLWNYKVKKLQKIARVGVDKGWTQVEFVKKEDGTFDWLPLKGKES